MDLFLVAFAVANLENWSKEGTRRERASHHVSTSFTLSLKMKIYHDEGQMMTGLQPSPVVRAQ